MYKTDERKAGALPSDGDTARAAPDRMLRLVEVALAALGLSVLALPFALGLLLGQRRWEACADGRGGRFELLRLELPAQGLGGLLRRLGAGHAPLLWQIVQGRMSWVGPRLCAPNASAGGLRAQPGLVNSWYIRSRSAIAFEDEHATDADDQARRSVRQVLGVLARAACVSLLPPPVAQHPDTLEIGDVSIDNISMVEALARIDDLLLRGQGDLVCFANPACVNIAAADRGYRRALRRAALVLPDGIGIRIAGVLLGQPLKQNVNGTDLFPRLMEHLNGRGTRLYLLGGQPGVAERVAREIERRWPGVCVVGQRHGFFSTADEGAVVAGVRDSGAEILLVARGVPSQEVFVDRYAELLGVRLALGVGGLFDFVSGRIPRAPQWVREIGGEWVYRLIQEPGRMWRRYLLGNISFLLRVALQRWGWRQARLDAANARAETVASPHAGVRVLLFATPLAEASLPVPDNFPAALLPVGHASMVERQLEELARAGFSEVDLVCCEAPEAIRERVSDGSRWGLRLHWHWAKDAERPYQVLNSPSLAGADRLLIGHCDAWIDAASIQRLAESERVAVLAGAGGVPRWAGWSSVALGGLTNEASAWQRADLALHLLAQRARWMRLDPRRCQLGLDASALLRLQAVAAMDRAGLGAPASWIPMPWGAVSPTARIHPTARIAGPALIGPGCVIDAGAVLGSDAYLSRDVYVSAGCTVRHAVLMPDTYVAEGLALEHVVVNGNELSKLDLGVRTAVAAQDALLLTLRDGDASHGAWVGRGLALLLMLGLAPVALPACAVLRLRGRSLPWRHIEAVCAQGQGMTPRTQTLCIARDDQHGLSQALALWAELGDIVRARRSWFGIRPRTAAQWYALSQPWQRLLSQAPIGLLHAPAWYDDVAHRVEAQAAADLYLIAQARLRDRLRLGFTLLADPARLGRQG